MRTLLLSLVLGITACASAPPPEAKNPGPKQEGLAETSEPAEVTKASSEFHAEVIEVRDVGESAPYKSVKMRFANPSGKPCEVTQYELTWPGGRKLVNGERSSTFKSFLMPGDETRQRSLRVHPSDGETSSLAVADAKLHAECK